MESWPVLQETVQAPLAGKRSHTQKQKHRIGGLESPGKDGFNAAYTWLQEAFQLFTNEEPDEYRPYIIVLEGAQPEEEWTAKDSKESSSRAPA